MANATEINGKMVDLETGEITGKATTDTKNALKNANKKARIRDIEVEKQKEKEQIEAATNGVSKEALEDAVKTLGQATGSELYVGTKKKKFDKTPFGQLIIPNIDYLNRIKYLSDTECGFLTRITPLLEFGSNCLIMKNVFDDDGIEKDATPTSIAEYLGKERANVSRMMNKLKNKGVLATGETGIWVTSLDRSGNEKDRIVSSRTWFVNPNIICFSDREKIEKGTSRIFKNALKNFLVPKDPTKTKHNLPINFFGKPKD